MKKKLVVGKRELRVANVDADENKTRRGNAEEWKRIFGDDCTNNAATPYKMFGGAGESDLIKVPKRRGGEPHMYFTLFDLVPLFARRVHTADGKKKYFLHFVVGTFFC